ncbi:MAG: toxin-antitoxin system YwqK family antitoxin [Bacteroidota bacterium]
MKKLIHILLFISIISYSPVKAGIAQQFELYNNDTINRIDVNNLKQGYWICFGKDNELSGYTADQKIEEGNYVDNRKTGIWKKYYSNNNLQNEITYINSRPNGYAKIYYQNGNIKEEGLWKGNKWVGEYKFYHENGNLYHEFAYNPKGKREGVQKYYHDNGQVMIEGEWAEGKEAGVIKEYDESGKITSEKFFSEGTLDPASTIIYEKEEKPEEKPKEVKSRVIVEIDDKPRNLEPFNGNGEHKLYNRNRQISKDGFFKNNRLVDGKWYKYSKDGILLRIEVYKNGAYAGDAPIEEQ